MIKEIDGVKIHYETSGDSGSRILLLHGWGCSIQLMKPDTANACSVSSGKPGFIHAILSRTASVPVLPPGLPPHIRKW